MKRKEILDELNKFGIVPASDSNIKNLTDEQLKLRLKLFKAMSKEGDRALSD